MIGIALGSEELVSNKEFLVHGARNPPKFTALYSRFWQGRYELTGLEADEVIIGQLEIR